MNGEPWVYGIAPGDIIWDVKEGGGLGFVIAHVPGEQFTIMWLDNLPHGGIRTYELKNGFVGRPITEYTWLGRMKRQTCKA